jgi:hypothetical protein
MTQLTQVRRRLVILSPFGLVVTCHLVARAAGPALGAWAWVPTMTVFWATIAALILCAAGRNALGRWLQAPQGGWAWSVLALAVGLLSLREFLADWHVLESPTILSLWLAFGLLNPWFEESYWRGLLIDATAGWVGGLGVAYSTLLFALSLPRLSACCSWVGCGVWLTVGQGAFATPSQATPSPTFSGFQYRHC